MTSDSTLIRLGRLQTEENHNSVNIPMEMEMAEQKTIARNNFEVKKFSVTSSTYRSYHGLSRSLTMSQAAAIISLRTLED